MKEKLITIKNKTTMKHNQTESTTFAFISFFLIMIAMLLIMYGLSGCTKRTETCYECQYGSAGTVHKRDVCTEGRPEDELPKSDANGPIGWGCKRKK